MIEARPRLWPVYRLPGPVDNGLRSLGIFTHFARPAHVGEFSRIFLTYGEAETAPPAYTAGTTGQFAYELMLTKKEGEGVSNIIAIQQFLVGKTFSIPTYQRDYAWTTQQVEDLFEDVSEAIVTASPHYLGTVVLARNGSSSYEVVDGQQRLSTLMLVINALLEQLLPNHEQRIADTAILLRQGNQLKLDFGNNANFVNALLKGRKPKPATAGQRKLFAACVYASERARTLAHQGGQGLVVQWLDTLKTLEIIEFIAQDTGRAIRMFQTVNDRGLPLSATDKAKALLVFYSNRYLNGKLDVRVNKAFGRCFSAFDAIREHVRKPGMRVNNIARDAFSEDDILRYHYLSFSFQDAVNIGDWDGSLHTVFEGFLKGTLKRFSANPDRLRAFISDYVEDLSSFCTAFLGLVSDTENNARLYKYLVVLGASARLYPLTVRLYQRNMLFDVPNRTAVDLLKCLEVCDVRVYKTRGTEPAKDIGLVSHMSRSATVEQISDSLRAFAGRFMPDRYFLTQLGHDVYHNQALTLIMLDYDENCSGIKYKVAVLQDLVSQQITREHILSQTPSFSVVAHGFNDEDDFASHLHQLGNLTPLTKSENSKCSNVSVHSKMTKPSLYTASRYATTRLLAQEYIAGNQRFQKAELQQRTTNLSAWALQRWFLW